jgi:hypothetical protein
MQQSVTRRAFLGTVVGAGVLAVPLASNADANADTTKARAIFGLSADWGAGDAACVPDRGESACGGCYACIRHAHNKVFATAAAARSGRAHPRCKCVVIPLGVLSPAVYDVLFASSRSVDRRTPGIEALLTRPAPPRQTPPAANTPLHGSLPFTGARMVPLALGGFGALVVGATVLRSSRRTLPSPPAADAAPDRH